MMDKMAFQNIQKKLGLTNEGVSEALDVELLTVQMWACGIWSVPRPIVKFLRTLFIMQKDNVATFQAGYAKGLDVGYCKGYNKRHDEAKKPNLDCLMEIQGKL